MMKSRHTLPAVKSAHLARIVSSAIVGVAIVVSVADAAERKVRMKDLPAVVQKAVQAETQGLTLVGLTRETENGKIFYEAETKKDGRTRDILFDATGNVVSVEQQIALDEAPAPVKAAFSALGKVVLIETVTKGSIVTYEAQVVKNGKRSEVVVDGTGQRVKN